MDNKYILADRFDAVAHHSVEEGCEDTFTDGVYWMLTELDKAPAEDVRPNIYAEWIGVNYNEKECSNCHEKELWMNAIRYDYCPHCGAIMKKVVKE